MNNDVERTPDGHHIVVKGRKWRATDVSIPENLRTELVKELMRARREVGRRGDEVRPCVQDAKVALGERGEPWWEEPSEEGLRARIAASIRTLLRHRDGKSICPNDAARVVGGEQWKELLPMTCEVTQVLVEQQVAVVTQKGKPVDVKEASGPVRIAPGTKLRR